MHAFQNNRLWHLFKVNTLLATSVGDQAMYKTAALLLLMAVPLASQAADCSITRTAAGAGSMIALAPVASELATPDYRHGANGGVLAHSVEEPQTLDQVLMRLRNEECERVAMAAAGAYQKQTEFDNTPYRFNMTQEGRRMTADDFDAWLQSNGYTVGRRAEPVVVPAVAPPPSGE